MAWEFTVKVISLFHMSQGIFVLIKHENPRLAFFSTESGRTAGVAKNLASVMGAPKKSDVNEKEMIAVL